MLDSIKKYIDDNNLIEKTKNAVTDTLDYAEEHKEGILITSAALAAASNIVHNIRTENRMRQKALRTSYTQWDPKNMHAWELRRKLTNREHIELDRRIRNGERMVDVLSDMRVLR